MVGLHPYKEWYNAMHQKSAICILTGRNTVASSLKGSLLRHEISIYKTVTKLTKFRSKNNGLQSMFLYATITVTNADNPARRYHFRLIPTLKKAANHSNLFQSYLHKSKNTINLSASG